MPASRTIHRHTRFSLIAATLLAAIPGCGGDDPVVDRGGDEPRQTPVHVHGLGVNPSDGALLIATHTGLFRVERGQSRAARIGKSSQDTMGFTVIGPDRFLGSGHPAQLANAINPLGLIRSTDAGRTWKTVSLSGEADFHVLRYAKGRVYGFDGANARFMVSADGGSSWAERAVPGPLIDVAVHPDDPNRLVAVGEDGLHLSRNGGKRWRALGGVAGLLAWPDSDRLYEVDASGAVQVSSDGGRRWSPRGRIGGQPAALLGAGKGELFAALADGTIKRSRDGGESWTVRSAP